MQNQGEYLRYEGELYSKGVSLVAGVDEAGRGPLAGPVVASAVILPAGLEIPGVKDSKKLSPKQREHFFELIHSRAIAVGTAVVSHEEIDKINILQASLFAMRTAVERLSPRPEHVLIDGPFKIKVDIPQSAIKRGDALSQSIAAASIIAKVTRDRIMCDFQKEYPNFNFSIHKGYGTERHYKELEEFGPTPIHRRSFLKSIA